MIHDLRYMIIIPTRIEDNYNLSIFRLKDNDAEKVNLNLINFKSNQMDSLIQVQHGKLSESFYFVH